jgi:hypothetical protein
MNDEYAICMGCGQVFLDEYGERLYDDEPSPCCQCSGDDILPWPDFEIEEFFRIVHDQDLTTPQGQRVAIVFLCTALEAFLESELTDLVYAVRAPSKVAEILLDSNRGRARMIGLFNGLIDQKLDVILKSIGLENFMQDWTMLAELRNKLVHGKYYLRNRRTSIRYLDNSDINIIKMLDADCTRAFAAVHNYICQEIGDGLANGVQPL